MSSQATLSITGMHCASCAAIITRRLKKTSGVEEVNVNYGSQKARVRFDPTQTNDQALIAAVKAAGYGATIANEHDREADKKRRKAEITGYRKRFFIGLVLSLPMLYFMARAFLPFLPFPPSLNSWMGIASLILATAVQFWLGAGSSVKYQISTSKWLHCSSPSYSSANGWRRGRRAARAKRFKSL